MTVKELKATIAHQLSRYPDHAIVDVPNNMLAIGISEKPGYHNTVEIHTDVECDELNSTHLRK